MMRRFVVFASMLVGLFAGPWTGACGKEADDVAPVPDAAPDGLSLDADAAVDVVGAIDGCVKSTGLICPRGANTSATDLTCPAGDGCNFCRCHGGCSLRACGDASGTVPLGCLFALPTEGEPCAPDGQICWYLLSDGTCVHPLCVAGAWSIGASGPCT
jgi:hypothetical protein